MKKEWLGTYELNSITIKKILLLVGEKLGFHLFKFEFYSR
jgi:hypothetical protein